MPRPSELIDAARLLTSSPTAPPTDGHIRRAISTAYYALFHAVLTAGADRFFGTTERNRAGYTSGQMIRPLASANAPRRSCGVTRRKCVNIFDGWYRAIVYRSFDHSRVKRVCEDLARSTPTQALQRQVRRASFSPDIRDFADASVLLPASRHIADYDPTATLQLEDALAAIDRAERAMTSFASAPDDERSDLLAMMLASGRS